MRLLTDYNFEQSRLLGLEQCVLYSFNGIST